jgi:transcriptional regulator with XRE-family HTH domain
MRRTKRDKGTSPLRAVLGRNVAALRDARYSRLPHETARNKALALAAESSVSQIQRVITGEVGASIDVIDALAVALDVSVIDLLTPYELLTPGKLVQATAPNPGTTKPVIQ